MAAQVKGFGILEVVLILLFPVLAAGQGTGIEYLSGRGADDGVDWEFYCTAGQRSGEWSTIKVPSNWELQGFGNYDYGLVKKKSNEQGKYRRKFNVPVEWREQGRRVKLVFEGVMTDTEVWVNGQSAGPLHQGGFYRFEYDITDKLKWGAENKAEENLLEVTVSKVSANPNVEDAERGADYWVFGGIFRPVYLKAVPAEYIDWTSIDARADGSFRIDVHTSSLAECDLLRAQILDDQGNKFGAPFTVALDKSTSQCLLETKAEQQKNWSGETPNLYSVQLELCAGERVAHRITERFGFRTFEVREGDGLYLNGKKIKLKGVNRHSFWPDSGRCMSEKISYGDARLIKAMNMNSVRMSHYPPEKEFLDACDELGLYVLDELAGWHRPPYDTPTGKKLVREMLLRDVNHPSIVLWDNGNEGGWNDELDGEFGKYDLQKRAVLHPWRTFSGVDTTHYDDYTTLTQKLKGPAIHMPTEFLHGMYDGGHGASLEDFWNAMRDAPLGAGGFLWVLGDEGVVRTDKGGILDTDANHGPDGIVGPYREKEGSYYTIKELWSPVQIGLGELPKKFKGKIPLRNEYDFSNLNRLKFSWQWIKFALPAETIAGHQVMQQGQMPGPDVGPGGAGTLSIPLPKGWRDCDALRLTATDWDGMDIWSWSWPLRTRDELVAQNREAGVRKKLQTSTDESSIVVSGENFSYRFDKQTGALQEVKLGGRIFPFGAGPRLAAQLNARKFNKYPAVPALGEPAVTFRERRKDCRIRALNCGGFNEFEWTVEPNGRLSLKYAYTLAGDHDYFGVTFDCAEKNMQSMRWLGQGPFRVWKNRLKGGELDVWQREYNRAIAGQVWTYPEFSGYYDDFYWAELQLNPGLLRVRCMSDDIYLRVGELLNGADPVRTDVPNPPGDVSFMHGISAIGSKGRVPARQGPQSMPAQANGTYTGELIFEFE